MKTIKPKVLVTVPVDHIKETRNVLENIGDVIYLKYPSKEELLNVIPECDALFPNVRLMIDRTIVDKARRLRVISTPSIGTDHIDLSCCKSRGIDVLSLAEDHEIMKEIPSTSEYAFGLMMNLVKSMPWAYQSVLEGGWSDVKFKGRDLKGRNLGIVGAGRIGSRLVRLALAFEMNVFINDILDKSEIVGAKQVGVDELLSRSEIISLHIPLNEMNESLVNKSWFDKMNGVYFINTSRGAVINENDLVAALESGKVKAAALDVLCGETTGNISDNILVQYAKTHTNVMITPHCAGKATDGQIVTFTHAARKLIKYFDQ